MEVEVIAYARNGFTDKFGIPRQSREESVLETRIEFTEAFQDANMLRGIEGFSHLWLIWGFSEAKSWSPTVRPPRLGGNKRVGVFATRSPFRPNHLGLSSVRLVRVENGNHNENENENENENANHNANENENHNHNRKGRMALVVSGADLLDGTPIYDIKPYLSYSDSHEDAVNGFAEATKDYRLEVVGLSEDEQELREILSQDPRPSYQNDPERVYKMDYKGREVSFRVENMTIYVVKIAPK